MSFKIKCSSFVTLECLNTKIAAASRIEPLSETLEAGNTTGGTDISISNGDVITAAPGDPVSLVTADNAAGSTGNIELCIGEGIVNVPNLAGDLVVKGTALGAPVNSAIPHFIWMQTNTVGGQTRTGINGTPGPLNTPVYLSDVHGQWLISYDLTIGGAIADTALVNIIYGKPYATTPTVLMSPHMTNVPPFVSGVTSGMYVINSSTTGFSVAISSAIGAVANSLELSFNYFVIGQ